MQSVHVWRAQMVWRHDGGDDKRKDRESRPYLKRDRLRKTVRLSGREGVLQYAFTLCILVAEEDVVRLLRNSGGIHRSCPSGIGEYSAW